MCMCGLNDKGRKRLSKTRAMGQKLTHLSNTRIQWYGNYSTEYFTTCPSPNFYRADFPTFFLHFFQSYYLVACERRRIFSVTGTVTEKIRCVRRLIIWPVCYKKGLLAISFPANANITRQKAWLHWCKLWSETIDFRCLLKWLFLKPLHALLVSTADSKQWSSLGYDLQ